MKGKAIFYLLLASLIYGGFVVLNKFLLDMGYKPLSLSVSLGIFILIYSFTYSMNKLSKIKEISQKNWLKIVLIGLLATFCGRILMFYGQKFTTAINAGFLMKLTSLSVLPFAYFMLNEKIEKKVLIPLLIMIFGVFLLTTGGKLIVPRVGDILIITLVVLIGFTNSLAKQVMGDVNPYIISALRLTIGSSLLVGLFTIFFGFEIFTPLLENWLWVSVGGTMGFVYILSFYRGIELIGASRATIFFLLSAPITTLFAYIFLGEVISIIQLFGGVLILIGGYLMAKY